VKEIRAGLLWVVQLLTTLSERPTVRRYRVTPRQGAAVFRRQLLADVLHSLKHNPID
jgi:hypothetical protein